MVYKTVEIPFITIGNRQAITALQAYKTPWVKQFVNRFPACFEFDHNQNLWIYYPAGDAPHE